MNADELTVKSHDTYICTRCDIQRHTPVGFGLPNGWQMARYRPASQNEFGIGPCCTDCLPTILALQSDQRTHDSTSAIDDEPSEQKTVRTEPVGLEEEATPQQPSFGTKPRFYKVTLTFHTDMGAVISDLIIAAANAKEAAKIIDAVDPFHSGDLVSIIITPAPLDAYFTTVPHPADRPLFTR